MSIDGSSYNCSIQSGQWTMPFKIYYSIARKYSRLGNQKTNLKHNSLSFKGIWNIFLKFQVFQVFLKCHKKVFSTGFPGVWALQDRWKFHNIFFLYNSDLEIPLPIYWPLGFLHSIFSIFLEILAMYLTPWFFFFSGISQFSCFSSAYSRWLVSSYQVLGIARYFLR